MLTYEFKCDHCSPPCTMLRLEHRPGVDKLTWRRNWKRIAAGDPSLPKVQAIGCGVCGCMHRLVDDGVAVEDGGFVDLEDVSQPRIDSVSNSIGHRAGGEAIYIYGVALDVGTLVVKFNGVPAQQVSNRASDRARVVTPVGQYALSVQTLLTEASFIVGESVVGAMSGARAVVKSTNPLVVSAPTTSFLGGEDVLGDASGAKLTLMATPYSGKVDVTVENEHGQRQEGGTLAGGFTYA